MAVSKSWTFQKIYDNAVNYISSIDACNIGKTPTIPDSLKKGSVVYTKTDTTLKSAPCMTYKKTITTLDGDKSTTKNDSGVLEHNSSVNDLNAYKLILGESDTYTLTRMCVVKTTDGVPSSLQESVSKDTVEQQFTDLLDNRNLTNEKFKGKTCSIRDIQAVLDTMVSFILQKYVLWISPKGDEQLLFYDKSSNSILEINYDYSIVDVAKSLNLEGAQNIMSRITQVALSSVKHNRVGVEASFSSSCSSSSSSSSCSSSCSSSSCSSSCSSSSCSSSSSSFFIAYMRLV